VDSLWLHFGQAMRKSFSATMAALTAFFLHRSRPKFKARLAGIQPFDARTLPIRPEVVAEICRAREEGNLTCLVTAAHEGVAQAVAELNPYFDRVWASTGTHNLKSAQKGAFLCSEFGAGGYVYVGDCSADFPVWETAGRAVVVAPEGKIPGSLSAKCPKLQPLPVARKEPLAGFRLFLRAWLRGAPQET
jgi:phosphoserine phosphatase